MRSLVVLLVVGALGCTPSRSSSSTSSSSSSMPSSSAPSSASSASSAIPPGSGDYSAMLTVASRYKRGELTFDELTNAVVARKLAVHKLGDGYLMTPAPVPPPGVKFDPRMMPKDWEGTFGEVAMAYWLGELTRDEYDRLHRAAHPSCPK